MYIENTLQIGALRNLHIYLTFARKYDTLEISLVRLSRTSFYPDLAIEHCRVPARSSLKPLYIYINLNAYLTNTACICKRERNETAFLLSDSERGGSIGGDFVKIHHFSDILQHFILNHYSSRASPVGGSLFIKFTGSIDALYAVVSFRVKSIEVISMKENHV